MATSSYDLIVIGAGPGGYVAAIRAAQLGLKTACVEKRKTLGGTCLNVGCIPSKALLTSSEKFAEANGHMKMHGVNFSGVKLDLKAMMKHKETVVSDNTKGIDFLFKKNKVDRLEGTAKITGQNEVSIGKKKYAAKNILIATGSESVSLPGIDIDEKQIVSSTGALEFSNVPESLTVIGGGVIGLELGSVWQRLGTDVTVIEFLDNILPGMDNEVRKSMKRILEKQGIKFKLGTKVTSAKSSKTGVELTLEDAAGGNKQKLKSDAVLVAVGRRPYTDGLGLKELGINMDNRGRIATDDHFRTNIANIYAIGDVIKGPMLAHKAEDEGVAAADIIAGQVGHVNYDAIPGVVYTWPEVATVGKTEEQLKEEGITYKSGKFPFSANGRARAMGHTEGFAKILSDAKTDKILGAHIIGPDAGTLIAELVLAMEFGASAEDVALTCHAHPTLNEVVKEAALAVDKRQIHS